MIDNNTEKKILLHALNALKENFNFHAEIETEEIQHPHMRADYRVSIEVNRTELQFYAEVKKNITNITLAQIVIHKLNEAHAGNVLLITKYVTPQLANKLRQEKIQFIDTAGNAYINQPPLYIYVKGNRLPEELRPTPVKRAFKPTGLKLIYAFLCNPELENKPYRKIAATANVALGTVGWIMRDLKEMGYLLDMGKQGCKLMDKDKLLERWVIEYPEKLRPKLTLGRYQGAPGWWVQATLTPNHAQWGGEVAAADLTKYLKPQEATLYIDPTQLNQILLDNRLRKDPNGETEVLERFWKPDKNQLEEGTVNPMLVYADLLATGNQRNIETAKIIYEQYITRYLREG